MKTPRTLWGRGILAGAVGATALAVWFLVIDTIAGEPFRTPAFLARALGLDEVRVGALMIAAYTFVHYAAFALVGVVVTWIVEQLDAVAHSVFGIVLGFLLFDLVFYGSLLITGIDVVRELGWPEVLIGNIIAGLAIFGTLRAMGATEAVSFRTILRQHETIQEGLVTGLIGAVVVALWFLIIDLVAGRVLYTPGALGSALFEGARSTAEVQITWLTVLGYTGIHVTAFVITGMIGAAIVWAAEEYSEALLLGAVLLFVTFEALSIGLLSIVSYWLVDALSWWNIGVANLLAAVSMGSYLALRHPALLRDVQERDFEEDLANEVPAPGVNHHHA